jgi:hypothetical protein
MCSNTRTAEYDVEIIVRIWQRLSRLDDLRVVQERVGQHHRVDVASLHMGAAAPEDCSAPPVGVVVVEQRLAATRAEIEHAVGGLQHGGDPDIERNHAVHVTEPADIRPGVEAS